MGNNRVGKKRMFINERKAYQEHTATPNNTRTIHAKLTFDEALDLFVKAKEAEGVRTRTVKDYLKHIEWFKRYLSDFHPQCIYIDNLTPTIIRDYVRYMKNERRPYEGVEKRERDRKGLSINTINIRLRTLKSMCNIWHADGYIESNPMKGIKQLRNPHEDEINGFSDEEVRALLRAPSERQYAGWRDKVLMLLLLDTGLRINEAVTLQIDALDTKRRTLRVKSEIAKNGKPREVPISREVLKALTELYSESASYFGETDYIFLSAYGEPLSADTFRRRLWNYAKDCGIKQATPHMFRHTFCRDYILNGGDIFTLQRIVDHADISTTRRYIQMDDHHVRGQHNRYSPLRKFIR
ncbi:tyrosine-type recombinase/integrase [Priestia flexa]|uniref:tyrosine-type recombinase/integrase n=1 Tax=Priestia flexa TaxID=86664 RepID=UPI000C24B175|nr:tyrosine-type recombinase/integrase [Priestia flexa]MEC0664705.1 tyrosine-type recombinase/integrase [Priestia flexa]MED3824557.1 tyrosine-type recombinase/integrase [Priestia flexa]